MTRTRLTWMLALTTALAVGQAVGFSFEDTAKNLRVQSRDGRGARTASGYHIVLRGNVLVTIQNEGTRITSDQLEGDIRAGAGTPGQLQRAVATGNFHLVKQVKTPSGAQSTDIQSAKANYRTEANQAVVDFPVAVRFQNFDGEKNQSLDARGDKGSATLVSRNQSTTPGAIRTADLSGNVKVNVTEANSKGQSKLLATGDTMHMDALAKPRRIVLTGHVNVTGQGTNQGFQVRNQSRVILTLNEKNEVGSWSTEVGP